SRPKLIERTNFGDPRFFLRPRYIPHGREVEHRPIFQWENEHRLGSDTDEISQVGNIIHPQKIMPTGIVDEQRLQTLVAHRLASSRYPFVEFLLTFHNHLVLLVS